MPRAPRRCPRRVGEPRKRLQKCTESPRRACSAAPSTVKFTALRPIHAGEELLTNYGYTPTKLTHLNAVTSQNAGDPEAHPGVVVVDFGKTQSEKFDYNFTKNMLTVLKVVAGRAHCNVQGKCVDGPWKNAHGHDCATIRTDQWSTGDWVDVNQTKAAFACCGDKFSKLTDAFCTQRIALSNSGNLDPRQNRTGNATVPRLFTNRSGYVKSAWMATDKFAAWEVVGAVDALLQGSTAIEADTGSVGRVGGGTGSSLTLPQITYRAVKDKLAKGGY